MEERRPGARAKPAGAGALSGVVSVVKKCRQSATDHSFHLVFVLTRCEVKVAAPPALHHDLNKARFPPPAGRPQHSPTGPVSASLSSCVCTHR